MPSDFDFDDVDLDSIKKTIAPVQTTNNQALVEQPEQFSQALAVEEEEPDELTVRMSKAHYYWTIVNSRLLEEDDRFAQEVEQEMQDFARERLAALMGATAPKKRGRPAKTQTKAPISIPRTFVPRTPVKTAQVAAKPLLKSATPKTDVPTSAKDTGEEVLREIEMADGSKMTKVYKKVVDRDSGKVYYMGYDVGPGGRMSDGQKYTLEQNAAGGQFFRVFNQQTILKDQPRVGKEQYEAQIQAESERHAAATLGAIRNGAFNYGGMGNLIAQAIEKAKKE